MAQPPSHFDRTTVMKRPLLPWRSSSTFLVLLFLGGCAGSAPLAPKAVEMNRQGVEALESGDYAVAEARFAVALEYHPRFVEALVNLGLTELARGNHERARTLFARAKRINADLPHPHHGLGVLADQERRPNDALSHYRDALKVDPGFVPSRANLARDYFQARMFDEAREQFLRLTEVAPSDDRGPAGLIETLLQMKRFADADTTLQQARERLGERPSLALLAARRDLDNGHVNEARSSFEKIASSRHAFTTAAMAWWAVADLAANDATSAILHAERALAADQHEPVATYALALALEAKRDPSAHAWRERVRKLSGGRIR